jgi:hypothetical protein
VEVEEAANASVEAVERARRAAARARTAAAEAAIAATLALETAKGDKVQANQDMRLRRRPSPRPEIGSTRKWMRALESGRARTEATEALQA